MGMNGRWRYDGLVAVSWHPFRESSRNLKTGRFTGKVMELIRFIAPAAASWSFREGHSEELVECLPTPCVYRRN